jgi:hypothetical protein
MTAPIPTFIQIPSDSSNSGKLLRAESKVVNAQTVLEQFVVPVQGFTFYQSGGLHLCANSSLALTAAGQDGVSTGYIWLQNPIGSPISVVPRSIVLDLSATSATVAASAPVITCRKFTFTGTASSGVFNKLSYQSGGVSAQADCQTAVTGMTVTLSGRFGELVAPAILTAVGTYGTTKYVFQQDPQAWIRGMVYEIAPGEGLVIYQNGAGSTSDPRTLGFAISWFEIDLS